MKLLYLQGSLYFIIGALTPVGAMLASDAAMTQRTITLMSVTGIIAGATAVKAFLSTSFANSKANPDNK